MSIESDSYRRRAEEQRTEAEQTTLPNIRARALHAAETWDLMADQIERSAIATAKREADKMVRDAARYEKRD